MRPCIKLMHGMRHERAAPGACADARKSPRTAVLSFLSRFWSAVEMESAPLRPSSQGHRHTPPSSITTVVSSTLTGDRTPAGTAYSIYTVVYRPAVSPHASKQSGRVARSQLRAPCTHTIKYTYTRCTYLHTSDRCACPCTLSQISPL